MEIFEQITERKIGKTVKSMLEEAHSGFRKSRGTHDHIFTVKHIIEKSII